MLVVECVKKSLNIFVGHGVNITGQPLPNGQRSGLIATSNQGIVSCRHQTKGRRLLVKFLSEFLRCFANVNGLLDKGGDLVACHLVPSQIDILHSDNHLSNLGIKVVFLQDRDPNVVGIEPESISKVLTMDHGKGKG